MTNGEDRAITIVSGLPRSGTSMMMQMIHAGGIPALTDQVRAADEDNPKGYYEYEPVKKTKEDPSWLDRAEGAVVKMVHVLLLDLPTDRDYRVVFMRRNLNEVVASQNVMLTRRGKDQGGLPEERIIQVFQAQLNKVDQHLRDHECFRVLHVDYNHLIRNPGESVRAVHEFLGGTLDLDAMLDVVDPSLYRQRR
jgi:hypothetical protein